MPSIGSWDWSRCGSACLLAGLLLSACGETTQHPSDASRGEAGSEGDAGSAGTGGAGEGSTCPKSQPTGTCSGSLSCVYPGSTNPCAPPTATATCRDGVWHTVNEPQQGVCVEEVCSDSYNGCPNQLPFKGEDCSQCYPNGASCTYPSAIATCTGGVWKVRNDGEGGFGFGGGASSGGAGGSNEAGQGGAP